MSIAAAVRKACLGHFLSFPSSPSSSSSCAIVSVGGKKIKKIDKATNKNEQEGVAKNNFNFHFLSLFKKREKCFQFFNDVLGYAIQGAGIHSRLHVRSKLKLGTNGYCAIAISTSHRVRRCYNNLV